MNSMGEEKTCQEPFAALHEIGGSISCVQRFNAVPDTFLPSWFTSNAIVGLFGLTEMPKSF
jgi:hypothetical protein